MNARTTILCGLSLAMWAGTAHAAPATDLPEAGLRLVIVEHRAGTTDLPDLAERITRTARTQTNYTIISPNEARQSFGDDLAAAIAACASDAKCLAKVGAAMRADELLLVGVSDLGGTLLTLQRVDVRSSKASGRLAETFAPGSTPSPDELKALLSRVLPAARFLQFGGLRIIANVDGADVFVAGQARGKTPLAAITVRAPANYELQLTKTGYEPFNAEVFVPPDGRVDVKASLVETASGPWYGGWAGATTIAVVGIAVVGGIVWAMTGDDEVHITGRLD